MKILVTGSAGYIGSTTAALLLESDHEVNVFDILSMSHRVAVPVRGIFILGDMTHRHELGGVFREHRAEAVMHCR